MKIFNRRKKNKNQRTQSETVQKILTNSQIEAQVKARIRGEAKSGTGGHSPNLLKRFLPESYRQRVIILVVVFLTFLMSGLLINQAKIAKLGFENAQNESIIRFMKMKNAQDRERIFKSADLAHLRKEAERLGMSAPLDGQILRLNVPRQDYISFNQNDSQENPEKDWLLAMHIVANHLRLVQKEQPTIALVFNAEGQLVAANAEPDVNQGGIKTADGSADGNGQTKSDNVFKVNNVRRDGNATAIASEPANKALTAINSTSNAESGTSDANSMAPERVVIDPTFGVEAWESSNQSVNNESDRANSSQNPVAATDSANSYPGQTSDQTPNRIDNNQDNSEEAKR